VGVLGDAFVAYGGAWVSGALDLWVAGAYYYPRQQSGHAPLGDVFWTGVAAVPYISAIETAVYVGGYDSIHWNEPYSH